MAELPEIIIKLDKEIVEYIEAAKAERIAYLEAEVTRLRAALEQVEWETYDVTGETCCPWCYGDEPNHEADCPRQAALS
jgi:uncharacterized protein YydD (DUF2326 family)